MKEKEWQVYINDEYVSTVYDETKEGAEQFIAQDKGLEYARSEGYVSIVAWDTGATEEEMEPH